MFNFCYEMNCIPILNDNRSRRWKETVISGYSDLKVERRALKQGRPGAQESSKERLRAISELFRAGSIYPPCERFLTTLLEYYGCELDRPAPYLDSCFIPDLLKCHRPVSGSGNMICLGFVLYSSRAGRRDGKGPPAQLPCAGLC